MDKKQYSEVSVSVTHRKDTKLPNHADSSSYISVS